MLTERQGFTDDNGNPTIITVDEILESYEIKGLTLDELQEKYVNTVDEYDEKINEMEDEYEKLNSNFLSLQETIEELSSNIEEKEYSESLETTSMSSYIVIFVVVVIIAFLIGKNFNRKS